MSNERDLQQRLRDSEQLDPATAARLRAAREQALAQLDRPAFWHTWAMPVAGFASIALTVAIWWTVPEPVNDAAITAMADWDLLTAEEQLDLYAELEFYQWLASEQEAFNSEGTSRG